MEALQAGTGRPLTCRKPGIKKEELASACRACAEATACAAADEAAEDEQAFERIAPSRREGGAKPNEPSPSWSEVASGKRFFFSLDNHSLFAESALSTRLNDALRLRAVREGFGYGDIGEDVTDGATGLLRDFFQPLQHDTHLHLERSLFFWRRAILDATKGLLEWC